MPRYNIPVNVTMMLSINAKDMEQALDFSRVAVVTELTKTRFHYESHQLDILEDQIEEE